MTSRCQLIFSLIDRGMWLVKDAMLGTKKLWLPNWPCIPLFVYVVKIQGKLAWSDRGLK